MEERYWLRERGCAWQQATQEQFFNAERRAGFHSKSGSGVATGGFSSSSASHEGRVTYGEITDENYGHDPEFLIAVKEHDRRKETLEYIRGLKPAPDTDLDFDYYQE